MRGGEGEGEEEGRKRRKEGEERYVELRGDTVHREDEAEERSHSEWRKASVEFQIETGGNNVERSGKTPAPHLKCKSKL